MRLVAPLVDQCTDVSRSGVSVHYFGYAQSARVGFLGLVVRTGGVECGIQRAKGDGRSGRL
jgi:hypothetical protein